FAMSLGRQVAKKSRVGRGSGLYARFRLALLSGQLVVYANVDGNSPPEPATFRDEEGTVTLQFDAGKTCTVPVKVVSCQIDENHKTEDQWRITFTCDVIGDVTWAGFGSAPDNVVNSTA